jgi:hypothetical protein
MNRASPVELRKAMEIARVLTTAGILFVAIPVMDEQDHAELVFKLSRRLEKMESDAVAAEVKS